MTRRLMSARMVAAAIVSLAAAAPAMAQPFAKPEDAIKYRKAAFTVLARHFGVVAAMANNRLPYDAKAAAENADIANVVARLPYAGFVPGSERGGDTKADPKIWSEMPKFNAAAQKMQDEMGKLAAAAKSGNMDQLKSAVGATGAACKACHDDYRMQ
jgi:cytochrome c556